MGADVVCPIITLVPATTAMFGVVRDWRRGDEPSILRAFVRHLRANFRQAFGIGLLWLVTLAVLFLDYRLVRELPAGAQFPALVVLRWPLSLSPPPRCTSSR